jgi:cell division transport system permease protein
MTWSAWSKQTWATLRAGAGAFAFAVMLTSLSLVVLAAALHASVLVQAMFARVSQSTAAVVFLRAAGAREAAETRAVVDALPGAGRTLLLSPEEALTRATRHTTAAARKDLAGVVMPWVIELSPSVGADRTTLVQSVRALPTVDEVAEPGPELERIDRLLRGGIAAFSLLALLLVMIVVVVVGNAVRLALLRRQEELRVLALLGASRWFVWLPASAAALFAGLAAACTATVVVVLVVRPAFVAIAETLVVTAVPPRLVVQLLGFVALSSLLSLCGAAFSLRARKT